MKQSDFHKNTQKDTFLKKVPYVKGISQLINKFISQLGSKFSSKNYLVLRKSVGIYCDTNTIRTDTFDNWFLNDYFPLPFIRVLSILLNSEKIIIESISHGIITDFSRQSNFKPILTLEKLIQPFIFYFIGTSFGDGTLNEERWKLIDGVIDPKDLHFSRKYLEKVGICLKGIFNISYRIDKDKNAYVLCITNKWFCRFLNFFFGLPFGKKRNLEFPLIIKLAPNKTELVKLLVRGVCDTDGGVDKSRFSIINTDNLLIKQLEDELRQLRIDFKRKTITKDRKRPAFVLRVPSHQLVEFGIEIGLSHPRKQKELIKILTTETPHRILSNVRKDRMIEGKYFDLDLIPNLYVIGAGKIFKELKERVNLPETRLANLIGIKERTIRIYEKLPNKAVPFKLLSRISKFAGISAVNLYSKLKKEKLLWSTKRNEIKLPLSLDRKILWIAEHVRPKPEGTAKVKIVKMLKGKIIPPKKLNQIISACQKLFNIKVSKGKNEYYINSACLRHFFDTFFEYEPFWKPLSQEESERILKEWNDIWSI